MVVCNISRFYAKFIIYPRNKLRKHIVNLANTYETILVVFYKHSKFLK